MSSVKHGPHGAEPGWGEATLGSPGAERQQRCRVALPGPDMAQEPCDGVLGGDRLRQGEQERPQRGRVELGRQAIGEVFLR